MDHNYDGISHEVIVNSDPINTMQMQIANLNETVMKLMEIVKDKVTDDSSYPKEHTVGRKKPYTPPSGEDDVSLYGDSSSIIESSHGGISDEGEPPAKLSRRARPMLDKTQGQVSKNTSSETGKAPKAHSHVSNNTSSKTAERHDGTSDVNALFRGTENPSKGIPQASLEVDEEILSAVEAERPPDINTKTGEPVLQNLAERVIKYWQTDIKKSETHKLIQEKYKTPANCSNIAVPLVNEVIYRNLNAYTRRHDHELADTQRDLISVTNVLTLISQAILEADKKSTMINSKDIIKMCFDGITMLGTAHAKLNNRRKQAISPALDPEIKDVCSARHTVTDYLFGDDLPKAIKDAKEVSRLSKSVGSQSYHRGKKRSSHGYSGAYQNNHSARGTSSHRSFFQRAKKPTFKQKKPLC